jgi:tetratricopeptide (TPR) repeat protein
MQNNRLEALLQFVEARPDDCFVRYGLAQEYAKAGDIEAALEQYARILEINPDYQPAYYHAGKVYEAAGRGDEARGMYERGIEASLRTGDAHARSELEAALEGLA